MLNLKISKTGSAPLLFDFPEAPSEWPVRHLIDFYIANEKFDQWLSSDEASLDDHLTFKYQSLIYKSKCVSSFLGIDINEFYNVDVHSVSDDSLFTTIDTLYKNITQFVFKIKPNEAVFDENSRYIYQYKGETYHLDPIIVAGMNGEEAFDIKLGHYVEIMDRKRVLYNNVSKSEKKSAREIDPEGSKQYTMFLTTVAALSQKTTQERPTSPEVFERYVSNQVHYLKDIDIQTAIDIDFFLSVTLSGLKNVRSMNSFLRNLNIDQSNHLKRRKQGQNKEKSHK